MAARDHSPQMSEQEHPQGQRDGVPFAIWQTGGATEHLGGVAATQRLLAMCPIRPGQLLLDIGCGTGYTACSLAQEHGARVLALDAGERSVEEARKRVARAGLGEQVRVLRADAHDLPCADSSIDGVIVESVLVFCDAARVLAQIQRVLKSGGFLGANEMTFLKPPTPELLRLLVDTLGMHTFQADEWQATLSEAGFAGVRGTVSKMRLWEQLVSHVRVDGVRRYLAAVVKGLADTRIRGTFINRSILKAARQYTSSIGYGLYTGRKGPDPREGST